MNINTKNTHNPFMKASYPGSSQKPHQQGRYLMPGSQSNNTPVLQPLAPQYPNYNQPNLQPLAPQYPNYNQPIITNTSMQDCKEMCNGNVAEYRGSGGTNVSVGLNNKKNDSTFFGIEVDTTTKDVVCLCDTKNTCSM